MVTEESVIERIREAYGHVSPPENAFTINDYIAACAEDGVDVSRETALRILRESKDAGTLNGRQIQVDGRRRWVFWA